MSDEILLNESYTLKPSDDHKPPELTCADIDKFCDDLMSGAYDIKEIPCFKCSKDHFPNYGRHLMECDECYFSRFPKEQVEAFCRSFLQ